METIKITDYAFVAELLRTGGTARIKVLGNSMRPYLIHERDYVLLQRQDTVQVGDIVFAEVQPHHYILHRVVKIAGELLTLRGDGNRTIEQCKLSNVCGTVIGFYRKGRTELEELNTLRYSLYTSFWMHTLPLRRYMLYAHNLVFHSVKNFE